MKKLWLLLILIVTRFSYASNLIVVADMGGVSTQPLFEQVVELSDVDALDNQVLLPEKTTFSVEDIIYPVTSELTVGQVDKRSIELPNMQPIFIIGNDPMSKNWLSKNLKKLQQIDALGLVTNVQNARQFDELQHLAPNLLLLPIPIDDITHRLEIKHYPVLITDRWVTQ